MATLAATVDKTRALKISNKLLYLLWHINIVLP